MYPTLFKIPFLPDWLADVKSYGVMLMVAFLTGIWMACRRADRSQANADTVLNIGFLSLICGVAGARIMFVWHYWDSRFANTPNPLAAVFDLRSGGLEFWGGPLLVIPVLILYLRRYAKVSVRWYLDITAPSLAWGLAVTRIGCFLNGCCWGAACVDHTDPARERAEIPWAVHFPYGSPAMVQQFKFGQLTIPKELITVDRAGESTPFYAEYLKLAAADNGKTYTALNDRLTAARLAPARPEIAADPNKLARANEELQAATRALQQFTQSDPIGAVEQHARRFGLTAAQLWEMAQHYHSKPAHPTQLYETISASIICLVLTLLFYYRERHGIVLGWFLMLYSISRILNESIRQDNPLDSMGLTISQFISIGTFVTGLAWVIVLHTKFPKFSPRAVPFVYPDEPSPQPATR